MLLCAANSAQFNFIFSRINSVLLSNATFCYIIKKSDNSSSQIFIPNS
uniref:Uncharacterized protein n=1 Tax=Arundo donax TaxID=35708 RepID=A0A0A9FDR8_ARUDO